MYTTLIFNSFWSRTKCSYLNFTRGHTILAITKYTTNNSPIQKKDSCTGFRDLGVIIDANVRFDHICRSTRRKLGFLFRNAKQLKNSRLNDCFIQAWSVVNSSIAKLIFGTQATKHTIACKAYREDLLNSTQQDLKKTITILQREVKINLTFYWYDLSSKIVERNHHTELMSQLSFKTILKVHCI